MAFLLDLDVIWEKTGDAASRADALGVVDDLRERERDAFEAVITDKARDLFDSAMRASIQRSAATSASAQSRSIVVGPAPTSSCIR